VGHRLFAVGQKKSTPKAREKGKQVEPAQALLRQYGYELIRALDIVLSRWADTKQ